ncbi:MAG: PAS domain-containing sensor histidine kinase [Bacteroidota bacterium]
MKDTKTLISFTLSLFIIAMTLLVYFLYIDHQSKYDSLAMTYDVEYKEELWSILKKSIALSKPFDTIPTPQERDSLIFKKLNEYTDSIYDETGNIFLFVIDTNGMMRVTPQESLRDSSFYEMETDGEKFNKYVISTLKIMDKEEITNKGETNQFQFFVYALRRTHTIYLSCIQMYKGKYIIGASRIIFSIEKDWKITIAVIAFLIGISSCVLWLILKHTIFKQKILEQAVLKSACPIVITDTKGKIEWWNEMFGDFYGLHKGKQIMAVSEFPNLYEKIKECIKKGRSSYTSSLHSIDGSIRVAKTTLTKFTDETGRTRIIFIDDDITKVENIKNYVISFLNHDLKNLVEFKIIEAKIVMENIIESNNELRKNPYMQNLMDVIDQIHEAIANFVEWGKYRVGDLRLDQEIWDLKVVINNVVEKRQIFTSFHKIKFSVNVPEKTLVYIDHFLISSVLRNLIGNSIKAIAGNTAAKSREIEFSVKDMGPSIKVLVSDTGMGMDKAKYDNLFINYTNKSAKELSGLGTIICKTFIERHGGEIKVEKSAINEGTTIGFTLPKPGTFKKQI